MRLVFKGHSNSAQVVITQRERATKQKEKKKKMKEEETSSHHCYVTLVVGTEKGDRENSTFLGYLVWLFFYSFLLKIKNDYKNVYGWI